MTEKELRRLNRSRLQDLVRTQSYEIEHLSGMLETLKGSLESPVIERPEPGSLTEAQTVALECFRRAQEKADRYIAALNTVCGSGES